MTSNRAIDPQSGISARSQPESTALFVNVHIPYDGEIAQTDEFLPFDEVDGLLTALPDRDAKIVLYCRSGSMSTTAAQALVAAGYTNVWNLDGGMNAWRAAGYTVVERPPG